MVYPQRFWVLKSNEHTLTISAVDYLGNTAIESIEFFVGATFRSLIQDIRQAYKQGWIKYKAIKKALIKLAKKTKRQKRQFIRKILLRQGFLNILKGFHQSRLINKQAYQLLKSDVEYLIKNL